MILDQIVEKTRIRIQKEKTEISPKEMRNKAKELSSDTGYPFLKALSKKGMSYICEVKKASPSKGIISEDFNYIEIAKEYEKIGASAISVLTEPDYFQGNILFLKDIKEKVNLPLLRKDFIIDPYMIDQAKVNGADAILLICALLTEEELSTYQAYAESLGLSALVEAHNEEEVAKALRARAKIIGINNRDLRDFSVDIHNSLRYRHLIPEDVIFVSESGITERDQIIELEANHVNAVLIGETMMKAKDKQGMMDTLRGYTHED